MAAENEKKEERILKSIFLNTNEVCYTLERYEFGRWNKIRPFVLVPDYMWPKKKFKELEVITKKYLS